MAKRKALGRGLGAFFPDYEEDQQGENKQQDKESGNYYADPGKRVNVVMELPVNNIRPNPHQPRKEFDEQRLLELSDSIQRHGLIQPITVHHLGDDRYELISGERRLRAAKLAGVDDIPAYIREVNDDDILAYALIENIQREELNPMEVAMGYQRLMEECQYTQEEVARKVGKNRSTITNLLRLLQLPDYIQAALRDEKISMGHARALINVENKGDQKKLLEEAVEKEYSVRQVEEAVRKLQKKRAAEKEGAPNKDKEEHQAVYREITNQLRNKLSTKVDIKSKKKGGEIRISYYSNDELDRILKLFENIS